MNNYEVSNLLSQHAHRGRGRTKNTMQHMVVCKEIFYYLKTVKHVLNIKAASYCILIYINIQFRQYTILFGHPVCFSKA